MLVANHPNPVPSGVFIDALYGEESHDKAHRTVQAYISNLRRILGANTIGRTSGGWLLNCARSDIDALHFEDEAFGQSDSEDPPSVRARKLAELLQMWHGHPYADIDAHGLLDAEVTRLNELRVSVLCARVDADLAAGRHFEVIGELEALLASHPYDERLRGQHMLALYRSGRQKEALRSYRAVNDLLVDELGVDPGPRLQELEIQILEQSSALDLPTPTLIESRAILVADLADPFAPALDDIAGLVEAKIEANGGVALGPAGTAVYGSFTEIADAIDTATWLASCYSDLKVGLDFGEVEVSEVGVSGPPVLRCARLVATAHPGQVLVSAPAHSTATLDGASGIRFETLGRQPIGGIDEPLGVFQLLVGSSDSAFPPLALERVPAQTPRGPASNPAGYELREPIGEGPVGVLHRGYHPATGREVMVEVISRSEASTAEFIRRFEFDAQRLSLVQHPNLLPVLDYWRDEQGAFVVYPWWRGGGFAEASGSIDGDRVLDQVASALDYAHAIGLAHGSLSPKRIALDGTGNGYLFGFPAGIRAPNSDPAYLPPEESDTEVSTDADIYAFAVLAKAVGEGSPPDPDLPAMAVDVATGGADTARAVLDYLRAGRSRVSVDSGAARRNPFKGLAPFFEHDAEHFFGRDDVVEELVTAMSDSALVAVVGPSGVGKSSAVRAGLLPALRSGAVLGSEEWLISDMYPSDDPFRELAPALARVAAAMPLSLRGRLADQDPTALDELPSVLPSESTLILVIDQFEELFTLPDEETRVRFIDLLARVVSRRSIRVVITMRADFLDKALSYSQLGSMLRRHVVAVGAPTAAQIGETVRGPLKSVGVPVDADLADRVVADVHDRRGALPLMQHALASAFDEREDGLLDLGSYESVGGVQGSVARHAESVWTEFEELEQRAMRQVLLRLVAYSDDNAPMRRRARWYEFAHLGADSAISRFVEERLLVSDFDHDARVPTLEVIHEALFTSWPRLRAWIEEQSVAITSARRLDVSISEWLGSDRSVDHLLAGGRLTHHVEWSRDSDLTLTPAQQEFLDASVAHEAQQVRDRRQRRALVMAGLGAVTLVAAVFGVFATRNAREARAEELAASSRAVLAEDPELAVLLGIEALELDSDSSGALDALHVALQSHRTVFALERPQQTFGSMSPKGDQLAVAVSDDYIELWSVDPQEMVWGTAAAEANVVWAHFNEAGTHLYIYGDDPLTLEPGWRVVDASTHEELYDEFIHFDFPWCTYPLPVLGTSDGFVHEGAPISMVSYEYLPEEDDCLWGSLPGSRALDPNTGELTDFGEFFVTEIVTPTVSDTGSRYAKAAQPPRIGGVYDYASRELIRELPPGVATLNGDGSLVLAGSDPMFLMEVDTGDVLASYPGAYSVAYFNKDESRVVGASFDGATRVFDVATGRLMHELRGPGSRPISVQISDDNSRVSSFHGTGVIRVWDVASTIFPTGSERVYEPAARAVAGQTVLLSDRLFVPVFDRGSSSTAEFDRESGNLVRIGAGFVLAAAPDESFVVLEREDGPFVVVDVDSRAVINVLEGPCDPSEPESCGSYPDAWQESALSGAISPDGVFFAMGGSSGNAAVWDVISGEVVAFFPGISLTSPGGVAGAHVEFSPDGSELAISLIGSKGFPLLLRVDTATWQIVDEVNLLSGLTEIKYALDGEAVVGSDFAANVAVIDRDNWLDLPSLGGQQGGSLADLDVSPDGAYMATASPSQGVWVWNLESMSVEHRLEFPATGVHSVEYLDDQTLLVTDSTSSVVVTLDPDSLLESARQRVTRPFTPQECETYGIQPCPAESDQS